MTSAAVGVDIGGTKVAAALVDRDGAVLSRVQRPTPPQEAGAAGVVEALVDVVEQLGGSGEALAVGIGAAGLVSAGRVLYCPHLPLRGEPLAAEVSERVGLPVFLDNDANVAALGEARFGAARSASLALCVTLGTGIGGAVLQGGELLRGAHGLAGEFGHMTVVPDGALCECGRRGCWEQYASGRALERMLPGSRGAAITDAARAGQADAVAAFAEVGRWLGLGLANLVASYDPDLLVVGGGVSDADDLLLEPARVALTGSLFAAGWRPMPPLVRATLGPDAGVVGAAAMALASAAR